MLFNKHYPKKDTPWTRGMRAQYNEFTLSQLDNIHGKIPADLQGTLYRVGPGKHDIGGHDLQHWFDGDGMVSAFKITNGQVGFKNRYIRSKSFLAEQAAGKPLYMNFGTPYPGGLIRAARTGKKNPANTNIFVHNQKLYAFWEGGLPVALDPETLQTFGEEDFDGALPPGTMFSAHPHHDPHTGDYFNISASLGRHPRLNIWRVSRHGRCEKIGRLPLKRPFLIHDFGVSASKIVILAAPYYLEAKRLLGAILGLYSMADCFTWHEGEPMLVYVIDKNGNQPVRHYELEAAMMVHAANAFDDGGDVVVDACLFPSGTPFVDIKLAFRGIMPDNPQSTLWRLRLRPDGSYSREQLCDFTFEFPRTNEHHSSLPYRYCYGLEFERGNFGSSRIGKIDTQTGRSQTHDFGRGCLAGEPVFVSRPNAKSEDDGWLLSMVYDSNDDHTFLGIVDAQALGGADIRAHLPFRIPLAFHGSFHAA